MLGRLFSGMRRQAAAAPAAAPAAVPAGNEAGLGKWLTDDVHPPFAIEDLRADPRRLRIACLLADGSDLRQAIEQARALYATQPDAVARMLLAEALLRGGDTDGAQQLAQAALTDTGAMGARAAAMLAEQALFGGELKRARELAERALARAPAALSAHVVLACALDGQGAFDEGLYPRALDHFRRALALRADLPMPRTFLAGALLRQGLLREGLTEWVMAEIGGGIYSNRDTCPVWAGQPLGQRRLLLIAHSGFGDIIQYLRFGRLLREREPQAHIALLVNGAMARLAQGMGCFDAVHRDGVGESFDFQVTQTQLALLLDVQPADLLAGYPYLRAPQEAVQAAAAWLPPCADATRLRVGLRWSGSSSLLRARRSMTLAHCAPLFAVAGVEWVALVEDAAAASEARAHGLVAVSDRISDFQDTAALMANLDLVISVDTSIANLGGALGVPTWVMCGAGADWRWGKTGTASPWYASARVFRHPPEGLDWAAMVAQVARALRERAGSA